MGISAELSTTLIGNWLTDCWQNMKGWPWILKGAHGLAHGLSLSLSFSLCHILSYTLTIYQTVTHTHPPPRTPTHTCTYIQALCDRNTFHIKKKGKKPTYMCAGTNTAPSLLFSHFLFLSEKKKKNPHTVTYDMPELWEQLQSKADAGTAPSE